MGRFQRSSRGGRGNRQQFNKKGNNKTQQEKKKLEDHVYHLGSAKQASDYEKTTDAVIDHIKMKFDDGIDMAKSLQKLELMTEQDWAPYEPTLKPTTQTDQALKEAERRQNEIVFRTKYDAYEKRKDNYEKNKTKAYALIKQRCSEAMKHKIEARNDFNIIEDNPVALLKAIKEHALNFQENKYEMHVVAQSLRTVLNTRQKEDEQLHAYTKRFRVAVEVLESHFGGPLLVSKIVKNMDEYKKAPTDQTVVDKCTRKTFDRLTAHIYLENADRSKYGSILSGLNTQHSLGNTQYPESITEANSVLSNHAFDKEYREKTKKQRAKDHESKKQENEEEDSPLSFAQLEGKCYCCGRQGHKSPSCREKDKPKDEWAINKARSNFLQTTKGNNAGRDANDEGASNTDNQSVAGSTQGGNNTGTANAQIGGTGQGNWSSTQLDLESLMQFFHASDMKEWILLDNESNTSIFCNRKYVYDIRKVSIGSDLHTNAGILKSDHQANVPQFGTVWFNEEAITNIFSFAEMRDKYKISYDHDDDTFIVHLPNKNVNFSRIGKLYVHIPKGQEGKSVALVNTIEENKQFYTERQVAKAKKARELYHAVGTPSLKDFKAMIRMNMIKDNPVTTQDIVIAEKIFGPDIGALKGKTTRQRPAPVVDDIIDIPRELVDAQHNVTLCIDVMNVNGEKFLATVSKNIFYRTAQWMRSQTTDTYLQALKEVMRVYRNGGFRVTEIRCDNEFRPLLEPLQAQFQVHINYANPQEHVPEAERNIRVLKERVRASYHRLPFKTMTKILLKTMVTEAAKKLNFFPAQGGVSPYYSPRMILHQRNLDYEKHCKFSTGMYVQAHDEPNPTNNQAPRTLDCIYLRYSDNHQGGHELLHLPTNQRIQRRQVTPIPINAAILRQVDSIARRERMPTGLKISNKTGHTLYDSDWIAGVDYEDENFEEEFEDQDYEDDEDDFDDDEFSEDEYDEMHPDEIYGLGDAHGQNNAEENAENEGENDENQDELEINENDDDDDNDNGQDENEDQEHDKNEQETAQNAGVLDTGPTTRSGRIIRPPSRMNLLQNGKPAKMNFYSDETAKVIAMTMCQFNDRIQMQMRQQGQQFVQTYSLAKGLKVFGEKGREAAKNEMQQIHDRVVFTPIDANELTELEKKRAMDSLIFLTEKRDGRIKGRTCANGSTQREYTDKEEAASPTAATESILITGTIDADERRDVMTADIPNAFVQTKVEQGKQGERIIMKIRGALVDLLVEIAPEVYQDHVVIAGKTKVLYVQMQKALYGMLQSALLYYKKFRKDIEEIGFKVNPYDPCVANRMVNGKQHTITWHVDDLKSSHVDPKVNDEFLKWLQAKYAEDGIGEVKAVRGKRHDYLAMILDYSTPGVLTVDMTDYVKGMIEDFPEELTGKESCPWNDNLFKQDDTKKALNEETKKIFHTFVMKAMFVCKRARQDILPAVAYLTTRVKEPNEGDWFKLKKMMNFLKATKDDVTKLSTDDTQTIRWHLDAAFAVHKDYKSHTGATATLGEGVIASVSTKQKINTRSSTEAELVSVDDVIAKIIWMKSFIEAQGFKVSMNIIYRDNTSAMKLEENGKQSSGKRTRHFNIKYFYITDLIKRGEVKVKYCPTDEMIADYMTKPLVGAKFATFRKAIMGF